MEEICDHVFLGQHVDCLCWQIKLLEHWNFYICFGLLWHQTPMFWVVRRFNPLYHTLYTRARI